MGTGSVKTPVKLFLRNGTGVPTLSGPLYPRKWDDSERGPVGGVVGLGRERCRDLRHILGVLVVLSVCPPEFI